jgi:methylphosphotriester-DNA--protein-cysteine methyltransferase
MNEQPETNLDTMEDGDELTQEINNGGDQLEEENTNTEENTETEDIEAESEDNNEPNKPEENDSEYFNDDLVSRANEYGLTVEEMQALGSNEMLEAHIKLLDKQFLKIGNESINNNKNNSNITNDNPSNTGVKPVNLDNVNTGFKVNLNPDVYEKDLIDSFEGLNNFYQEKISTIEKTFEEKFKAIEEREQKRELEFLHDSFDEMVNSLDDSFKEKLGKGTRFEIDNNSEAFKNRVKLLENMNALTAGFKAMNKQIPNFETLFKKALNMEYSDLNKKTVRQDIAKQLNKQNNRMTLPPTNTNKTLSSREKAIKHLQERLDEMGSI